MTTKDGPNPQTVFFFSWKLELKTPPSNWRNLTKWPEAGATTLLSQSTDCDILLVWRSWRSSRQSIGPWHHISIHFAGFNRTSTRFEVGGLAAVGYMPAAAWSVAVSLAEKWMQCRQCRCRVIEQTNQLSCRTRMSHGWVLDLRHKAPPVICQSSVSRGHQRSQATEASSSCVAPERTCHPEVQVTEKVSFTWWS